jgi:hypothetical protein
LLVTTSFFSGVAAALAEGRLSTGQGLREMEEDLLDFNDVDFLLVDCGFGEAD